jgi:glyoxylase-like metal-dependent hydrolase (beta-lactamase superfamily II)
MKIHFSFSGYCSADESHVYIGAPKGKTVFPAFWALIEHPSLGYILFDTGYSSHFLEATSSFPNSLYRMIVPVTFREEDSVKNKLKNDYNIDSQEIKYVIISHFHGDHTAGMLDFPKATFVCSRKGYEHIRDFSDFWAFRKAYLKKTLPLDLEKRMIFVEDFPSSEETNLGKIWNWKAANMQFFDLPGHARGQIGVLLHAKEGSESGDILLAADAAWDIFSVKNNVPPPKIVGIFADNYTELVSTIGKLHRYQKAFPDTKIIISHCKKSLEKYFKIV